MTPHTGGRRVRGEQLHQMEPTITSTPSTFSTFLHPACDHRTGSITEGSCQARDKEQHGTAAQGPVRQCRVVKTELPLDKGQLWIRDKTTGCAQPD